MPNPRDDIYAEYRSLLVAEASQSGVDRTLALAERVVGARIELRDEELYLRRLESEEEDEKKWLDQLSDAVRDHAASNMQLRAQERSHRKALLRLRTRVVTASIYLGDLPSLIFRFRTTSADESIPDEVYSLLIDTLMILFHQAYFALLPEIGGHYWQNERHLLIQGMFKYTEYVRSPADRYRLTALCYEARGEQAQANANRRSAVDAAHSDDEEFMTVLQTAWAGLVDRRQYLDALGLLLDNYPRIARENLDEMRQLIETTFRMSAKSKGRRLTNG